MLWSNSGFGVDTPNGVKYVYNMIQGKSWMIYGNADYTTFLHEFGHAVGYDGHSSDTSDIMYAYRAYRTVDRPINDDTKHIDQMY